MYRTSYISCCMKNLHAICVHYVYSHVSQLDRHLSNYSNTPEEDDETMSTHGHQAAVVHRLDCEPNAEDPTSAEELLRRLRLDKEQEVRHRHTQLQGHSFSVYQPHAGAYGGPTPFHSQVDGSWLHPSSASCSGYHNSLPSCLSHKDYSNCSEESFLSCSKFLSLPSGQSSVMSSLEQPLSLHSIPPSSDLCHHTLSPYLCSPQGAACCAQCPPDQFTRGPTVNKPHWPQYHPGPRTPCEFTGNLHNILALQIKQRFLLCPSCFRSRGLPASRTSLHTHVSALS